MSKRRTKHLIAVRMPDNQVLLLDTDKKRYLWFSEDLHETIKVMSLPDAGVCYDRLSSMQLHLKRGIKICL